MAKYTPKNRNGRAAADQTRHGYPERDNYNRRQTSSQRRVDGHSLYTERQRQAVQRPPRKKKKKHVAVWVILAIFIILIAAGAFIVVKAKAETNVLKAQAYELKDNLSEALDSVKGMDPDATEVAVKKVESSSSEMLDTLNKPLWKIISLVPGYGQDVTTARNMLTVLDQANKTVFEPFVDQMREHPLDELKSERGLNVGLILSYLDFADAVDPSIHEMSASVSDIKFNNMAIDLSEYSEKITGLFDALDALSEYKDLLRVLLGNGNDRLYLVMAQNTAEIRASGGFPGSMGTIRITDGYLNVGAFSSVLDFIYSPILPEANITDREVELFRSMYARWAHDACYNPHFAKMAHITKTAYDYRNSEPLDGIISLTPEIIQNILKLTDEEITISDGTVMNGDNATRVLQRDLYYKYQGDANTADANNDYVDGLFSETASVAMASLFHSIDISNFSEFMRLFREGCDKNTIMLWFANDEEEQTSIDLNCSGNLNSNPEDPFAGVYFSCADPGKLGMFVAIDTELSEPVENGNGELEYTATVTLRNYIDEEDTAGITSRYLLGNNGGSIQSYVYFFAPAGGTISDFETSNGMNITMSDYENLQVGYVIDLMLAPGSPVTVKYKVTTAAGVTAPLRMVKTPTLQEYR